MTVQKSRNVRTVTTVSGVALAVAVLVFAGTGILTTPARPGIELTSGMGATITSTLAASPGCTVAALSCPGTPGCIGNDTIAPGTSAQHDTLTDCPVVSP